VSLTRATAISCANQQEERRKSDDAGGGCSSKLSQAFVLDELFVVFFGRTVFLVRQGPGLQEVSVRNRIVQSVFLAAALFAVSAMPARAQTFGAGVSFLGDDRGPGVVVDYAGPLQRTAANHALNWVADVDFNHKGFGNDFIGVTGGVTTIMVQGGLRMVGTASDKVSWHAQGLIGLLHTGFSAEAAGLSKDVCDSFNVDCSAGTSDNGGVITFGGAAQYALTDKTGVRGQLDFPIALGAEGGGTYRFSVMFVIKRK
jgi:hypothetical protein